MTKPLDDRLEETVPEGVPTMTSRYGKFGAHAISGDRKMPCIDAEAQPPPPCAATGECGDLLRLSRRFETSSRRAQDLMQNALSAVEYAKVMLARASRGAKALTASPRLQRFAADARPGPGGFPWLSQNFLDVKFGPPMDDLKPQHLEGVVARYQARKDLDDRIPYYIGLAEDDDYASYPYSNEFVPHVEFSDENLLTAGAPEPLAMALALGTDVRLLCKSRPAASRRRPASRAAFAEFLTPLDEGRAASCRRCLLCGGEVGASRTASPSGRRSRIPCGRR